MKIYLAGRAGKRGRDRYWLSVVPLLRRLFSFDYFYFYNSSLKEIINLQKELKNESREDR